MVLEIMKRGLRDSLPSKNKLYYNKGNKINVDLITWVQSKNFLFLHHLNSNSTLHASNKIC